MKILGLITLTFLTTNLHAEQKQYVSQPFHKGECMAAIETSGEIKFKLVKKRNLEKLNQKISENDEGNMCSTQLRARLSIKENSGCNITCNPG